MPSLLELCRQLGLKAPADFVIWVPFCVVVTEAGQHKLEDMARHDPELQQQLFDASGAAIADLLAGHPKMSKRERRRLERLLRPGGW